MYDTIIVGAGIAGCTASIYASRKKMDFLLVSKDFGGQFYESGEILNYPGIKETNGGEFADRFREQLEFNNVELTTGEEVKEINKIHRAFRVITDRREYESKTVVIASGSAPKKLNVPGEERLKNKGVTYCSVCDGPLFADKEIAVIGGGNSALEGVDFTHKIAKKVYLINIQDKFNVHEYLIEKIQSYENVEVIKEAETTEILGDRFVEGLKYDKNQEEHELKIEGVIVEIGRIPNTGFLEGFLELDEKKHVNIDCQSRTSVEGIFAAGDCASGQEYQYAVAAGQGCIALLKAARFIAGKR